MFCIMDVSGSMDESRKDTAKRFFILLYLFLKRVYDKIEVVFIRHHTPASEVTSMNSSIPANRAARGVVGPQFADQDNRRALCRRDWNSYVAQASDGDNWDNDSIIVPAIADQHRDAAVQYYTYVEITDGEAQNLWHEYAGS